MKNQYQELVRKMERLEKKTEKAYSEYQKLCNEIQQIASIPLETETDNITVYANPMLGKSLYITLEDSDHDQYKGTHVGMSLDYFFELLNEPDFNLAKFYKNNIYSI